MPHHQSQDFIRIVEAAELASVRHLAAEDLPIVFARHHGLRSRDKGGEKPVERLDVHRSAALAAFEEVSEAVKFGVGQRLVLGERLHGFGRMVSAIVHFLTAADCPEESIFRSPEYTFAPQTSTAEVKRCCRDSQQ